MSTTVIDNLFSPDDAEPSYPYIRAIGGLNHHNNTLIPAAFHFDGSLHSTPGLASADAFSRFRASNPHSTFDSKQIYAKDTLFWTESLVTGATSTFLTNEASVQLEVTTTNGSSATRQTRQYMIYQPGKSQLIFITGLMGAIKANVRQRIGYFDNNNGVFFEQNGTDLRVVRRTFVSGSAVDNAVNQSSWNIDPLDGTGPSGYNLNTATVQIYVIDFSWLGVGQVRMGVISENFIIYCHAFVAANTLTAVWSQTPTLPVRFELTNTGASASNTTMKQICASVLSEGGLNPLGLVVSADTGDSATVATATETAIIGVRLNSTYNRATIEPLSFDVLSASANNLLVRVYVRATLTGGSWVASTGVASEINITPSGFSTTNAVKVATGYLSSNTNRTSSGFIKSSLALGSDFAGTTRDELVLTVENVSTGNNNTYASLTWKEIY